MSEQVIFYTWFDCAYLRNLRSMWVALLCWRMVATMLRNTPTDTTTTITNAPVVPSDLSQSFHTSRAFVSKQNHWFLLLYSIYWYTIGSGDTAQPDPTFLAVPFRLYMYKGYISVSLKKTLSQKMCARWAHRNID